MFATFPPSAGGQSGASGAAQFFTLKLDDNTVFESLDRNTDDGLRAMPVLAVVVPAGTETIKVINAMTSEHPQMGAFDYFLPVIEVDTTADVAYNFLSYGDGPRVFLSLAPYVEEGEVLQVSTNASTPHVRILDGKYEEVVNFELNGNPSWIGGVNYFPATPSTKNAENFDKTGVGPGTLLYRGFGRPPNGSAFRADGLFVYASVSAPMTLRFSLSDIDGNAIASIDLDFEPGSPARVLATPDEDWSNQAYPEIGSGQEYVSTSGQWVKTLTVQSGTGNIFGDIGFQGGESNAQFDF